MRWPWRILHAGSLILLVFVWAAQGVVWAQQTAKSPVLQALEDELQRSMAGLKEKGNPPPYFISYLVIEVERLRIGSSYGALKSESSGRSRLLDVDVRVGDYQLDNTRRIRGERFFFERPEPVALPLEDDPAAIRSAVWLATDKGYKAAADRLVQVKTNTTVKVKAEDESADFSRETPQTSVGQPARVAVDTTRWEKKLKGYSALFNDYPEIYESEVMLQAEATTKCFASSEGSSLQHGTTHLRVAIYAETKAEDGMELDRYEAFDAHSPERLPDDKVIRQAVAQMAKDLLALRAAPAIEPYTGPAILAGRAAGVFFHEIFGHRIEGHRQKDEEEGQTFTKKVNQPVLPDFVSVFDDPTREKMAGTDLNGYYLYDDEGVRGQRVVVVDRGILKNFLMSRSPVAGFDTSNEHGRKQPGLRAVGRQGNLIVEASQTVTEAKLRELLIAECTRQGRPFGLLFKDISGGFTFTGRFIPQAYQVRPIMVYRVYADGRPDELVRGVDLIGTPLVSFSKILACGDTPEVFNGFCGAESGMVPVSAVSPSILTAQIEIQKKEKSPDRPPLLPPPGRRVQ